MKIAVLGAGAWGTALGLILSRNGHQIRLWGHCTETLRSIERTRCNSKYLPGAELPSEWQFATEIPEALAGTDAAVLAVPSKAFREIASKMPYYPGLVISVTKGIESGTGLTMTGVLRECLPGIPVAALSGPTLAAEVAQGFPCAIVAASETSKVAEQVQKLFHRPAFRVYTSLDLLGVELGGALKNVIAIAAGIGDGLGFGDNSKAALVTRALAEMRRLGAACGAQPETFSGLSGLGDLMVTCFSKLSRNRTLGERLGKGEKLESILSSSNTVAEGYPTALSAYQLGQKLGVETPIIDEVYAMLYQDKNLSDTLRDLTTRTSKAENWQ